jgi:hypothetical protein
MEILMYTYIILYTLVFRCKQSSEMWMILGVCQKKNVVI